MISACQDFVIAVIAAYLVVSCDGSDWKKQGHVKLEATPNACVFVTDSLIVATQQGLFKLSLNDVSPSRLVLPQSNQSFQRLVVSNNNLAASRSSLTYVWDLNTGKTVCTFHGLILESFEDGQIVVLFRSAFGISSKTIVDIKTCDELPMFGSRDELMEEEFTQPTNYATYWNSDHTKLRLFDLKKGEVVDVVIDGTEIKKKTASPSGRFKVQESNRRINIFDTEIRKNVVVFDVESKYRILFSPTEHELLIASSDEESTEVFVVSLETGIRTAIGELEGIVSCMAWKRSGKGFSVGTSSGETNWWVKRRRPPEP